MFLDGNALSRVAHNSLFNLAKLIFVPLGVSLIPFAYLTVRLFLINKNSRNEPPISPSFLTTIRRLAKIPAGMDIAEAETDLLQVLLKANLPRGKTWADTTPYARTMQTRELLEDILRLSYEVTNLPRFSYILLSLRIPFRISSVRVHLV